MVHIYIIIYAYTIIIIYNISYVIYNISYNRHIFKVPNMCYDYYNEGYSSV